MNLLDITEALDARLLTPLPGEEAPIEGFCAGESISDLLNGASAGALVVTTLSNELLLRAMELLDAFALCLVGGAAPEADVVAGARRRGIVLLVSPFGLHDTCDRLRRRIGAACESGP